MIHALRIHALDVSVGGLRGQIIDNPVDRNSGDRTCMIGCSYCLKFNHIFLPIRR